ncbi:MAG: hypothetical protein QOH06_4580 [Acidobacteriota bacterium]|jgi:hypothetical protein|nr:hypothetical protein [Acidobacteriota bacterium]
MYEFHGWFGVRESVRDIDEGGLEAIIRSIRQLIDSFAWGAGYCALHVINGEYFVLTAGLRNHRGEEAHDLASLFSFLAHEAPGSYGLLYWRDDEDKSPPGPLFYRVRVLARGVVTDRVDPFLSPVIPALEDP